MKRAMAHEERRLLTVIKPPSRWTPMRLDEVWEFRDLLVRFTIRDLKLRYKQTALGVSLGRPAAPARGGDLQLRVRLGRGPSERRRAVLRVRLRRA